MRSRFSCSFLAKRILSSSAHPHQLPRTFSSLCLPSPPSSSNPIARAVTDCRLEPFTPWEGLWAVERLGKGKWFSKRDREDGRIPGYLFDSTKLDEHVLVVLDKYQILCLFSSLGQEKFLRTVFNMEVYDGLGSKNILYTQHVLPRRLNFDHRGTISNVGFAIAPGGTKLRLDSPILIFGKDDCLGVKKGGKLKIHTEYLSFSCLPHELPLYVEVKVDNLDIGDKVRVGDIETKVPLHPVSEPSLVICDIE